MSCVCVCVCGISGPVRTVRVAIHLPAQGRQSSPDVFAAAHFGAFHRRRRLLETLLPRSLDTC